VTLSTAELRRHLEAELAQRREEGCQVAAIERALADKRLSAGRLEGLLARLERLKERPDFGFREPSELAAIRRLRPRRARPTPPPRTSDLEDRILGGWLGRAAGCCLGKPVEGWINAEVSRDAQEILEAGLISSDTNKAVRIPVPSKLRR